MGEEYEKVLKCKESLWGKISITSSVRRVKNGKKCAAMAATRRNKWQREASSDIKGTVGGVCKVVAGRTDCYGNWGGETVYWTGEVKQFIGLGR